MGKLTLKDIKELFANNEVELSEGEGLFVAFGDKDVASVYMSGEREHLENMLANIMMKHRDVVIVLSNACSIEIKEYVKKLEKRNEEQ